MSEFNNLVINQQYIIENNDNYSLENIEIYGFNEKLFQLNSAAFQLACMSPELIEKNYNSNDKDIDIDNKIMDIPEDCTGLRMYSGAYCAIKALRYIKGKSFSFDSKTVIELGGGTGAVGLLGCYYHKEIKSLLITDGNPAAVSLQLKNIDYYKSLSNNNNNNNNNQTIPSLSSTKLLWGDDSTIETIKNLKNDYLGNESNHFDIVVGVELMYYRTKASDLLDTVLLLTNNTGIFFHTHIFRSVHQGDEIIQYFVKHNWKTLEIPINEFLTDEDLEIHPEWYKCRVLVSAPTIKCDELLDFHSTWKIFKEEIEELSDEEEVESDDEEMKEMRAKMASLIGNY